MYRVAALPIEERLNLLGVRSHSLSNLDNVSHVLCTAAVKVAFGNLDCHVVDGVAFEYFVQRLHVPVERLSPHHVVVTV